MRSRYRQTLRSATGLSGSMDIVDFLLPLFAGAALGLSPSQIGAVVAVELIATMAARLPTGRWVDTGERTRIAAWGAGLYGISCLGYAVASGPAVLYIAALIGGSGGALTWVAIRAIVAEHLSQDSASFAELLRAQSFGPLIFFPVAITITEFFGYRTTFAGLALTCLLASSLIAIAPSLDSHTGASDEQPETRQLRRRLGPLLAADALTAAAESGVGLVLLLHLQRALELDVWQIALLFLPGGIAMVLAPTHLHHLLMRWGRRRTVLTASLASAVFSAALAAAPSPVTISLLWVLTACAWSALGPIEDAVVAESSASRLGGGMSLHSLAALGGAAIGSYSAGVVYEMGQWATACLVFSALIALSGSITLWAFQKLSVADHPTANTGNGR